MDGKERSTSAAAGPVLAPAVNEAPERNGSLSGEASSGAERPRAGGDATESDASVEEIHQSQEKDRPKEEQWCVYLRRKGRDKRLDDRCLIMWGLPHDADPGLFAAEIRTTASCYWRGRKSNRHLVMEFDSELHRSALLHQTRENCATLGIRMAVVSRRHTLRQEQREEQAKRRQKPVEGLDRRKDIK